MLEGTDMENGWCPFWFSLSILKVFNPPSRLLVWAHFSPNSPIFSGGSTSSVASRAAVWHSAAARRRLCAPAWPNERSGCGGPPCSCRMFNRSGKGGQPLKTKKQTKSKRQRKKQTKTKRQKTTGRRGMMRCCYYFFLRWSCM